MRQDTRKARCMNCGATSPSTDCAATGFACQMEAAPSSGEVEQACPACGTVVKQVSSATPELAMWQHQNWVCKGGEAERLAAWLTREADKEDATARSEKLRRAADLRFRVSRTHNNDGFCTRCGTRYPNHNDSCIHYEYARTVGVVSPLNQDVPSASSGEAERCPHGNQPGECSWCNLRDDGGLPEAQDKRPVEDTLHDVFTRHGIASRSDLPFALISDLIHWAADECRYATRRVPASSGEAERLAAILEEPAFISLEVLREAAALLRQQATEITELQQRAERWRHCFESDAGNLEGEGR